MGQVAAPGPKAAASCRAAMGALHARLLSRGCCQHRWRCGCSRCSPRATQRSPTHPSGWISPQLLTQDGGLARIVQPQHLWHQEQAEESGACAAVRAQGCTTAGRGAPAGTPSGQPAPPARTRMRASLSPNKLSNRENQSPCGGAERPAGNVRPQAAQQRRRRQLKTSGRRRRGRRIDMKRWRWCV